MRGSKRQRKKKLYGTRNRKTSVWQIDEMYRVLYPVLDQIAHGAVELAVAAQQQKENQNVI